LHDAVCTCWHLGAELHLALRRPGTHLAAGRHLRNSDDLCRIRHWLICAYERLLRFNWQAAQPWKSVGAAHWRSLSNVLCRREHFLFVALNGH
jgi:hypothetical protein